jgi:hypothetical protein
MSYQPNRSIGTPSSPVTPNKRYLLYSQSRLLILMRLLSVCQKYNSIHIITPTNACMQYVFIMYSSLATRFSQHYDRHQVNLQEY